MSSSTEAVDGLIELEDALTKLDIKTSGTVLRTSLREEAKPMFSEIKKNLPEREGSLKSSARLSSNVGRSKRSKYSARARIIVGGKGTKNRSSAGHALQIEFGTKNIKAQAPIRTGFDSKADSFVTDFKSKLSKKILEAAKSGKQNN